jgi:hypothetical protein
MKPLNRIRELQARIHHALDKGHKALEALLNFLVEVTVFRASLSDLRSFIIPPEPVEPEKEQEQENGKED